MLSRVAIVILLVGALATAACDRGGAGNGQAAASADEASGAASPDEATAAPPTVPPGTVDRAHKGEPAATAAFTAPDGATTTLAAFKGTPLLVNLWATWCAPCIKEMPALDAAALAQKGRVRVIAVSQDMDGRVKVDPFFAARGFRALEPYTDPKLGLSLAYGVNLPTTILYDADGRELWRVSGAFDWTGAKAKALLAEAG